MVTSLRLGFHLGLLVFSIFGNILLMPIIKNNLHGLGLVAPFLQDGGFALFVNDRSGLPGDLACLQLLTSLLTLGVSEGFLVRSELRWGIFA